MCRALDRGTFAADMEPFAIEPDDHRNERFERAQILIVLTAEAERIGEALKGEGGLGGQCGQQNLLVGRGSPRTLQLRNRPEGVRRDRLRVPSSGVLLDPIAPRFRQVVGLQ
ncbi:MAG: hypothetical protein NVSMB64_16890 [Candidatus Velthaea sp.]